MLAQSDPITLTIDQDGGFTIEAPRVVVTAELGTFIADMGFAGTFRIGGDLDPENRVPMLLDGFEVTHRTLDTSGLGIPFGADFIANAIFDLMTAKMPKTTLIAIGSESKSDVLRMVSGPYVSALTRPTVTCTVEDVTFVGRHPEMRAASAEGRLRDAGDALIPPEWIKGNEVNAAVSYTRKGTVALDVTITVSDSGRPFKLFGIDKSNPAMNFESDVAISTGQSQRLLMHGKAPLPADPQVLHSTITWNVQTAEDERWFYAGKSGEHALYVTWDKPIEITSLIAPGVGEDLWRNRLTPARLDFALTDLPKGKLDAQIIADAVQKRINDFKSSGSIREPITSVMARTVTRDVANLWGLLDPDNKNYGNCFEATMLMEFALRLLGIKATQFHVYSSDSLAVLKDGMNIQYKKLNGSFYGNGVQRRKCEHHNQNEELVMAINPSPQPGQSFSLNEGEGCCEVEGVLYCGITSEVFSGTPGRPAAYQLLLAFEELYTKPKAEPRQLEFQVWSPADRNDDPCYYVDPKKDPDPAKNVIRKPGGMPVPKD